MNIEWKKTHTTYSFDGETWNVLWVDEQKQQQQHQAAAATNWAKWTFYKTFFFIRCFFPLLCRSLARAALYCVCFISSLCTNLVWLTAVWRTYMNKYYTLNCVYYRVTIYIFLMAAIFQTKIQFLFLLWILIAEKTEKKTTHTLWRTQA